MEGEAKLPAVCEHLRPVVEHIVRQGGTIVFAGQPWSRNCRLWVYFDVLLDCASLVARFELAACVEVHDHLGTHDGAERGLVCTEHHDAVMGPHPTLSHARTVG